MLHTMEGMRRWYWGALVERTGGGREVGLRNVWILCVKPSQHMNFFSQRAKIRGIRTGGGGWTTRWNGKKETGQVKKRLTCLDIIILAIDTGTSD